MSQHHPHQRETPDVQEPYIPAVEEEVLGILEKAGVPSEVNDKVIVIVHRLWENQWPPSSVVEAPNSGDGAYRP